jgi:hypothetical protein
VGKAAIAVKLIRTADIYQGRRGTERKYICPNYRAIFWFPASAPADALTA